MPGFLSRIRLFSRTDTSLAIAMVAGALVVFGKPLRFVVDAAHQVELRFDIDLIPGLVVLAGALAFHEYRKRLEVKAVAARLGVQAAQQGQRAVELERLVAFGRALGSALDAVALKQVFWRHLPWFAGDRELWMLMRAGDAWEGVVQDATTHSPRSDEEFAAVATAALAAPAEIAPQADGAEVRDEVCYPMVVGGVVLGVVGVKKGLSLTERRALGAAIALLAVSLRNVQLLKSTRESGLRDELTGCFNRAYAVETLGSELARSRRTSRPLAVLMVDVDGLKRVNDEHGHLAGDAVLAAVAAQLAATCRGADVKCRWGGDEFLIVLPDTPLSGAEHAGATLARDVAALSVPTSAGLVAPTISVGVAVAGPATPDAMDVVGRADRALYEAKRGGRNRCAVAQPALWAVG